ncbi:MAG: prepilin-type N-terminal cleavage/methylation domain-containing protein [Oscillospiraceae bacterium]
MKKLTNLKKNKKGFTLVELLVVLVILAILAAAIIPSMMGFIDKAKNESAAAECRNVLLAANVQLNEDYGTGKATGATYTVDSALVKTISGVKNTAGAITATKVAATGHYYISAIASFEASNGAVYAYADDGAGKAEWTKTN